MRTWDGARPPNHQLCPLGGCKYPVDSLTALGTKRCSLLPLPKSSSSRFQIYPPGILREAQPGMGPMARQGEPELDEPLRITWHRDGRTMGYGIPSPPHTHGRHSESITTLPIESGHVLPILHTPSAQPPESPESAHLWKGRALPEVNKQPISLSTAAYRLPDF